MISRRALTLIETVLALAMVAGMGVAVLSAISAAARTDAGARERRLAQTLVEDMIAEIMSVPVLPENGSGSAVLLGMPIGGSAQSQTPPAAIETNALDPTVQTLITGGAVPNVGRLRFAKVADYNNWSASPPQRRDGTSIPGYPANWRRTVRVQAMHSVYFTPVAIATPWAFIVQVEVTSNGRVLASGATIRTYGWDEVTSRREDR